MAAAAEAAFDLALDAAPLFSVPGRTPEWPWRAPGGVDRALSGAAARRLYPPGALHEACRLGHAAAVAAALDAGADVDARDEARRPRHRITRALAAELRCSRLRLVGAGRAHAAALRRRL